MQKCEYIEESILASLVSDDTFLFPVLDRIDTNTFITSKYSKMFECIKCYIKDGKPIDIEYINSEKYGFNKEEFAELFMKAPMPLNMVLTLCDDLSLLATRRDLRVLSRDALSLADADIESKDELNTKFLSKVNKIMLKNESTQDSTVESRNSVFWDVFNKRKNNQNALLGEPSGLKELDDVLLGFQNGQLYVLGARPSMGKSSLANNKFALSVAKNSKAVIIFSLEMPKDKVHERELSSLSRVPLRKIKTGQIDDKECMELLKASKELEDDCEIYIEDAGSVNIDKLVNKVKLLAVKCKKELGLLVIDYLQLLEGTKRENRTVEVSEISRKLKLLAIELDIPVVALSQLSRKIDDRENKRPILSDLRDSGAIEQDADVIMFIYRDDVYKKESEEKRVKKAEEKGRIYKSTYVEKEIEDAEIIVSKNRDGALKTIYCKFSKEVVDFTDN